MASMRDIKRRRSSIASTQQITNAMKLVSTVKLQKTKARAERSKPYFDKMYATVTSMLAKSGTIEHPYLKPQASGKKAVIVVTSNRGLAGGYNASVIKLITGSDLKPDDLLLYTLQISLDIISHTDIFFHGIIFCGRDINGAIQTKRQASGNVFCVSAIRLDPFPLFLMHR